MLCRGHVLADNHLVVSSKTLPCLVAQGLDGGFGDGAPSGSERVAFAQLIDRVFLLARSFNFKVPPYFISNVRALGKCPRQHVACGLPLVSEHSQLHRGFVCTVVGKGFRLTDARAVPACCVCFYFRAVSRGSRRENYFIPVTSYLRQLSS